MRRLRLLLFSGSVSLLERTGNKAVFLVGEGRYDVLAQLLLDLRHGAVAQRDPFGEMGTIRQLRLDLLVAFEQFHGKIARRKVLGQFVAIRLQMLVQRPERLLDDRTVIDVDVTHTGILVLIDGDHRIEQRLQTAPRFGYDGYHRHAEHRAQMFVIERRAARLQLVVHIERHDHFGIYVDQLGREIEIAFEVRGHHGVDHYVGRVVDQMATHIKFFGRISRKGISAGQIGNDELVSFVTVFAALGVDRHAAVIAHVLVAARNGVEQRGFAAVGITDQSDVDRTTARGDHLLHVHVAGRRSRTPG